MIQAQAAVNKERPIPFDISADPFYSEKNMNRLRTSISQMKTTGASVHEEFNAALTI